MIDLKRFCCLLKILPVSPPKLGSKQSKEVHKPAFLPVRTRVFCLLSAGYVYLHPEFLWVPLLVSPDTEQRTPAAD